jgi:hypothetical protein
MWPEQAVPMQFVGAQKLNRMASLQAWVASGTAGPLELRQAFPVRAKSLPAWKPPAHSKQAVRTRESSRRHWQQPGARELPPEHSAQQPFATQRFHHDRR